MIKNTTLHGVVVFRSGTGVPIAGSARPRSISLVDRNGRLGDDLDVGLLHELVLVVLEHDVVAGLNARVECVFIGPGLERFRRAIALLDAHRPLVRRDGVALLEAGTQNDPVHPPVRKLLAPACRLIRLVRREIVPR